MPTIHQSHQIKSINTGASKREWTASQKLAITARGTNIIVSAAAGSGKTAVLVERIIRLLREGASLDRMLVVTFSKLAAQEMRERISSALADADEPNLREQSLLVDSAEISTIHSFCTKTLRRHFAAVSVDPLFTVADDARRAILSDEAMELAQIEWYESLEAETDATRTALAKCLAPDAIADIARGLHGFIMALPNPWQWLEASLEAIPTDAQTLQGSPQVQFLTQSAALEFEAVAREFEDLAAEAEYEGYADYADLARDDANEVRLCAKTLAAMLDGFYRIKFKPKPSVKKADKTEYDDKFAKSRENIKKRYNVKCEPLEKLAAKPGDYAAENLLMKRQLEALVELVRLYDAKFAQLKAEAALLDFTDLERKTLDALDDAAVAAGLREHYHYVFVDEYQDSTQLQEAIINAFARFDNRFCVGDVKQSIYRFRDAEPSLFLDKYKSYSKDGNANGLRVDLDTNFRSTFPVIRAVNQVFRRLMRGDRLEIEYDDDAAMKPSRDDLQDVLPELHLVLNNKGENTYEDADGSFDDADKEEEKEAELSQVETEAGFAARRIRQLVMTGYNYSDIAILMRAFSDHSAAVTRVLKRGGVPCTARSREAFMESPEVLQLLGILKIIVNPLDDLSVLSALRSPACGLSEEELARVRIANPDEEWYEAVRAYARDRRDAIADKLSAFIETLDGWRFASALLALPELLTHIITKLEWQIKHPQTKRNLQEFVGVADTYASANGGASLRGFLQMVAKLDAAKQDREPETIPDGGAVRLLSIHGSKGLEFPVVIILGAGKRFNKRDAGKPLLMHKRLGLAMGVYDGRFIAKKKTLLHGILGQRIIRHAVAEEARILYVALTRAKERLIIYGTPKDAGKLLNAPRGNVSDSDALSANSYLEWLVMSMRGRPEYARLCGLAGYDGGERGFSGQQSDWDVFAERTEERTEERIEESAEEGTEAAEGKILQFPIALVPRETVIADTPPARTEEHIIEIRASFAPLKTSVTALTHSAEAETRRAEFTRRPNFMQEARTPTAAEHGSAVHLILSRVSLDAVRADAVAAISACEDALVVSGALARNIMRNADRASVLGFFASEIGARLLRSPRVMRELPFNYRASGDSGTLIQGVIDCCFVEDGAWVLIDFKTDRRAADELTAMYAAQVRLYGEALRWLTGTNVREMCIYSLWNNKSVILC
ncbi:MAG: UvrD-helicase domain-containing protein [Oscillospiraceae bacterium]|jgi:ATP-dependent helicase/nuclease subunit A|nr:UvrD-helicase domain-containing protein [Oscillospiraceae bacterium]